MDLSDEEEDGDSNIDDLLKALDGIEQCFVPDFEIPQPVPEPVPKPVSLPSVNIKKRSVVEPLPSTVSAVKRISFKDPRLHRIRPSPVVPKAPLLPVPNFGYSNDPSETNASNFEEISPKKSTSKPVVISTHLSKYSKFKPSTNMKSKHRLGNACRTSSSSRKSHSALLQKEPEKKFEEDTTTTATTENVTVRESLSEMLTKEMRKMEAWEEEDDNCIITSQFRAKNHSNGESFVKVLSKEMKKMEASEEEDDCVITSHFLTKNDLNRESLVKIYPKEMRKMEAPEEENDCVITSQFPLKNHSNRESSVKIHSKEMRRMEAFEEEDDCTITSQFPSRNHSCRESLVKIHSEDTRKIEPAEGEDGCMITSQFPLKNYLNRENLNKILSEEMRKIEAAEITSQFPSNNHLDQESLVKIHSKEMRKRKASGEKVECEIMPQLPSKNHSYESNRVPPPAKNSKSEETSNFQQIPQSIKALNFEIIEDLLHKLNASSSATGTNSVTCDPRIRKFFPPVVVNPEELSAGPITSQVCPEIEEQEVVSVSEGPEESLYSNQPVDNMQVVNMSMSEASEDESALEEKSDQIARGMSPPKKKKKKTKQIPRYGNSRLPPEILIKIFKYLPLSDKKSAKLVCRFWYDACTIKSFLMRQRFVCCGIYDTATILSTLSNSGCTYFNLEFHRVDFCHTFSSHWRQLGPRIHALYFVDCMLAEETLGDVIVHCKEMEHLSLSFERLRVPPAFKLFPRSLFEKLLERRTERPKLLSMDIQINSSRWFSNSILSNLFAIYPNITKLSFTCHSLSPVAAGVEAVPPRDIDFTDLWSSKALTFSPVLKYALSTPNAMEKLKLDVHTKGMRTGFGWQLVVSHSKFTRLREIAIEIDLKRLSGNAVIEFCIAQTELKTISCKIVGPAKLFISLFLFKLLDNCPRLRNLDVTYKASFILSYELYKRLVASKLKSLSIESSNVQLAPQIAGELEWPTNVYLRSLSLSEGVGSSLKKLFISIFRNLTFLEIHNLSDELLQLIWKYQTSLITLKLMGVEECTIDGFCGLPEDISSFSIRNLRNLEYLLLEAVNTEWQVYGNVFSEFQFPKLRYFCVDIEGSSTLQKDLLEAMQNFTELEGVSITSPGVERSVWVQLNRNWKKLRYLRIVDKETASGREIDMQCEYGETAYIV